MKISRPILLTLVMAVFLTGFFALASSALALPIGTSWSGSKEGTETEMEAVSQSGSQFLRIPLRPQWAPGGNWTVYYDKVFRNAAEHGVRLLPFIENEGKMPTTSTVEVSGPGSQSWGQFVKEAVERYGYNGSFWNDNSSLIAEPVTTWELDNEPNNTNDPATYMEPNEYGKFVAWAGPAVQAASKSKAERGTEVLFGSLWMPGDENAFHETLAYMEKAWAVTGVSTATTGVSVHPYEINLQNFKSQTAIHAFESALQLFRTGVKEKTKSGENVFKGLNELTLGNEKTLWITETGWPAEGAGWPAEESEVTAPAVQATLLRESFQFAESHASALKLQGYTWYNFRDAGGEGWAAHCGLISSAGVKRPAWTTFQDLAHAAMAPEVKVAYRDFGDANSASGWQYTTASGWQQMFFWGHEVAAGTQPVVLHYNEGTHIFFADASREGRITEWSWNSVSGWQQHELATDPVSPNSSPSGVVNGTTPEIYFADAGTNSEITRVRLVGSSWEQQRFYGDSVAKNSSPSAVVTSGSVRVFFNDESQGDTTTVWTVTPTTISSAHLGGDEFAANTSPSAVWTGEKVESYFVDANDSDALSVWVWGATTLFQQNLFQDSAMPNSSPSAIQTAGSTQIYFADASKSNEIGVWVWTPTTLYQTYLGGDPVQPNSSPSAVVNGASSQIFFSDEVTNGSVAVWEWGSTLAQTRLYGHLVASGSSPSAR